MTAIDEKALGAAIIEGSNMAGERLVTQIVTAYLKALGDEGWVLVPKEPTEAMDEKTLDAVRKLEWREVPDGMGGFIGSKQYRFVKYGWGGPEYGFEPYPNMEAAQAAAQRDFAILVLEMAAFAPPSALDEATHDR